MTHIPTEHIKSYYTPERVSKISKHLDEFTSGITKTSDIVVNTIMDALISKSDKHEILDKTFELTKKLDKKSEKIMFTIFNCYVDSQENREIANEFLSTLFGTNLDIVSKKISDKTFIRKESTSFILGISALLILAYLSENRMDRGTIIEFRDANLKELANNTEANNEQNIEIEKIESSEESKGKSYLKPILIFVAILGIFGIGYYFMMQSNTKKGEITAATEEPVITDTETQPQVISSKDKTKLGEYLDFTLPNDAILHIPTDGLENGLLKMILDNSTSLDHSNFWLIFDGINFDNRETEFKIDSETQIKNLAEILNSFPKVKIKIASYTDNLGDATSNKNLSTQRSNAVLKALVKLGVQQNRISAEGFGQEFPIATNDTEEGRADNRRISLKLIEK